MVSPLNPIGERLDFYVETLVSPFERVVFTIFLIWRSNNNSTMQFFNVESTLSSTQAKVFLLTVSYLLGLNTAVLVIAALVGVVCVALLYVHALYLCFGFLKTILDGLALHVLKKVVSSRSVRVFVMFHV